MGVVLWHGMGDSCCFPFSLGSLKKLILEQFQQNIYVKSLKIGGSLIRDYESGYFIHPNVQVSHVPLTHFTLNLIFQKDKIVVLSNKQRKSNNQITSLFLSFVSNKNAFCLNFHFQIKDACNQIKNDPNLKNGFNAIGFSQGSQFLRGLLQRCDGLPKMRNLITLGGQHQGVFGLPNCPSLTRSGCEYIRQLLNYAAYSK